MNRISDLSGPTRRLYRRGSDSYINLSVYAFGLAGLWISINTVLLQLRVLEFAAEDKKNGILGGIALVGLVVAAISQPLIGALSDRTTSRWGKRLPYIVVGNVCLLAVVPLLGLVNSFVSAMLVVGLIQFFIHVSQGPASALLIDHIRPEERGVGAGVLNLARVGGGGLTTITVMLLMSASEIGTGPTVWYWASIGVIMAILGITTLWTFGSLRPKNDSSEIMRRCAPENALPSDQTSTGHSSRMNGYYWFLIAMAMIVGGLTAMQIFALFFIRDKVGLDNPAAGAAALAATILVGAAIAAYPSGAISDRFGRMKILYLSAAVIAGSTISMLFVGSLIYVTLVGFFIGVGAGMFLSGGWALITELVPASGAGKSLGLTALSTLVGTGLARVSGFGIDALNQQSQNLGYDVLIIGIAALMVLSIYPLRRAGTGLS